MEYVLAIVMGVSLSAACGFRVFIPLLVAGLTSRLAGIPVPDALDWVCGDVALCCLGVAALVETSGYYIPYIDNLLDTINGPLAVVAGSLVMAGMLDAMPDYLQWGLAIVAGGGAAGAVQAGTTALRAASTATTGGLGNPVVSTVENGCSIIGSLLSILAPVLALIGLIITAVLVWLMLRRLHRRKNKMAAA
ncbi:MAG: DUF4126 domain-containing protein [Akkermansia sp.]|nr:DUF4126 domain-containing protein [Akkermansia sp.]